MLNIGAFARLGRVTPRTLRHYEELGLLRPERVDPQTGYRSYAPAQLARLHRLLALRDLGFTLEQTRPLLDGDLPVEQLRGMLRLRQAQIEQTLADEHERLRRVEAHLRTLEGTTAMITHDIVVKQTLPLRIAEATGVAEGFGPHIAPVFARLVPQVYGVLATSGVRPGVCIGYYGDPADDGSIVVHVGMEIGDQPFAATGGVEPVELPVVEVASHVHRGGMDTIESSYGGLMQWIDDSGYRAAGSSRELYLEWHADDPSACVTELQMPITR